MRKPLIVTGLLMLIAIISCVFIYYNKNFYHDFYHPENIKLSGKTAPSKKIIVSEPPSVGYDFHWYDRHGFEKSTKSNEDGYYEIYLRPGDYFIGFEDEPVESCDFVSGSGQPQIKLCNIMVSDQDLVINIKPVVK